MNVPLQARGRRRARLRARRLRARRLRVGRKSLGHAAGWFPNTAFTRWCRQPRRSRPNLGAGTPRCRVLSLGRGSTARTQPLSPCFAHHVSRRGRGLKFPCRTSAEGGTCRSCRHCHRCCRRCRRLSCAWARSCAGNLSYLSRRRQLRRQLTAKALQRNGDAPGATPASLRHMLSLTPRTRRSSLGSRLSQNMKGGRKPPPWFRGSGQENR